MYPYRSLYLLAISLVLGAAAPAVASTYLGPIPEGMGRISGTVVSERTGDRIAAALVKIVGAGRQAHSDLDGAFTIDLVPGDYSLEVVTATHPAQRVDGVVVTSGSVTETYLTVAARPATAVAADAGSEEIVVTGRKSPRALQILVRKTAPNVRDSISSEQIARLPDSSAADAVKRVVAATVVDNKYVVVRGLGGRYSQTLLNGVALPSPDPDQVAAPLDLFPAQLVSNLTVLKTFSPEIPGNFAGGVLDIATRQVPTERVFTLRLGGAGDSQSSFREARGYSGGNLDFLGYDDGSRSLPGSVPRDGPLAVRDGFTQADADAAGRSFNDTWAARGRTMAPGGSFALALGDDLTVGGRRLGYLTNLTYGRKSGRRLSSIARVDAAGTVMERREQVQGAQATALSGMVTVGWEPTDTDRLGVVALYTHTGDDFAQVTTGTPEGESSNTIEQRTSLRLVERTLAVAQLLGEHSLDTATSIKWQGNLTYTAQNEPDTRDLTYASVSGGPFRIATTGAGSADRTFNHLADLGGGGSVDVDTDWDRLKLREGVALQSTFKRDFDSRRFRFSVRDDALTSLPAERLFTSDNIGSGIRVEEVTRFTDAYEASRHVGAAFVSADLLVLEDLRLIGGVRYEQTRQKLSYGTPFSGTTSGASVARVDHDVLPALNAIYTLGDATNLRAAATLTVARPSFRELSPALFFDFGRGRTVSGNPALERSRIQNYDLRFEHFLGGNELVAASVFYKRFSRPIESVFKDQNGDSLTYVNTPRAVAYGGELEGRIDLKRVASWLSPFYAATNLSFVLSRIELDGAGAAFVEGTNRRRPLQGQSPYVVNVELGGHFRTGTDVTLAYNLFGRRISEVGVGSTPDAFEQPLHRLDATLSQSWGELRFKATATNLLDQAVVFKRAGVTVLEYRPGLAVSGLVEWSPE